MKNWAYAVEHWQDIFVYAALRSSPPQILQDWIKVLFIPAITVVVVVYVTQARLSSLNDRVAQLESKVETNTKIILRDQTLSERWGIRLDQLERRHDEIMSLLLSGVKAGSGYTYLPDENRKVNQR